MKALVAAAVVALALLVAPERAPRVVAVAAGANTAAGFVVGDGRVVTVAHVLGPRLLVDGRPARVLRRDDRLDLALLSVPGVSGSPPRIGRAGSRHLHARIDGSSWRRPVLEVHRDVRPGDSGTPVLSATGHVLGIVFARSRGRARVAYAVDASDRAVAGFIGR